MFLIGIATSLGTPAAGVTSHYYHFLFVSSYWVLLTGALFDVTDNYNLPFFATSVIALCGSLGMFALVLFQKLKTKDRKCDDDKKQ